MAVRRPRARMAPSDAVPDVTRLSEELLDLVLRALDHATRSIAFGGAFIPFVMAESVARERDNERFPTDTRETALKMAREHISQLAADVQRVALAYDGSVTIGGERSAAVLVEAQERGKAGSVIFAQRYEPGGDQQLAPICNAAFLGDGDPLF
jgi:hypothetical protein